ncbi:hypothetical protein F4679DRAFT_524561 [Xylaria curta]|nr:hypothetical protein F4679DRAFT_524561 [Xylaria curta]
MRILISLLTAAFAVALPTKMITTIAVEALQKGSRTGITNSTITVPVGPVYKAALHAVSALYVLDNDATSCIPYHSEHAFGSQSVFLFYKLFIAYFGNDPASVCYKCSLFNY